MTRSCKVGVVGLYSSGGDHHWLEAEWLGEIKDDKMMVAIMEASAYQEFKEDWMPNGYSCGVILWVPIENIRMGREDGTTD